MRTDRLSLRWDIKGEVKKGDERGLMWYVWGNLYRGEVVKKKEV